MCAHSGSFYSLHRPSLGIFPSKKGIWELSLRARIFLDSRVKGCEKKWHLWVLLLPLLSYSTDFALGWTRSPFFTFRCLLLKNNPGDFWNSHRTRRNLTITQITEFRPYLEKYFSTNGGVFFHLYFSITSFKGTLSRLLHKKKPIWHNFKIIFNRVRGVFYLVRKGKRG